MSAKSGPPPGQEPPKTTPHNAPTDCGSCQEFRLAEAVANAQHDPSAATDCRVLLRRHQRTNDCTGTEPVR